MTKLQPLKNGLLATRVADTVRRAIFSGHFPPGGQLLEAHLARELQVSQTTVREALVQLDQVGLVERVPNKGTFVTQLTEDEVRDRLTLRRVLEGMAWLEASKRMGDAELEELEKRLAPIAKASRANDMPLDADMELEFHRYIWEQSGNPTLVEILEKLTPPLFAFMVLRRHERGQSIAGAEERHRRIIDALRDGSTEVLADTLTDHFSSYGALAEDLPSGLIEPLPQAS